VIDGDDRTQLVDGRSDVALPVSNIRSNRDSDAMRASRI
jgi:hypothetical protein